MKTDVLIIGSGVSGLYCAINLPKDKKITIITKSEITKSDSYLAQGGRTAPHTGTSISRWIR